MQQTQEKKSLLLFLEKAFAFFKRDLLESFSYRLNFFLDLLGIFAQILPFFFIGKLIGERASGYLSGYQGDYFAFVLLGIAFGLYQSTALNSFSGAIEKEQETGTLEILMMTPTPFSLILISNVFWSFLAASLRVGLYLFIGSLVFGTDLSSINLAATALLIPLTLLSLSGFGLMAAGFLLVTKRGNPVAFAFNGVSKFLAGVYFPIAVLPDALEKLSAFFPLTYALEGLRKAILNGAGILELGSEIQGLLIFTLLFLPAGMIIFSRALRRAKREGSLTFR